MIGGDSIKSIQIIARMGSAGYKIDMKDLFQYPVIVDLAPRVKKLKRIPDQFAITGTIPLTPIQADFFHKSHFEPHHYNQAVMLYSQGFDKEALNIVFSKITAHHDTLRLTFKRNPRSGEIVQFNHDLNYPFSMAEFDLKNIENSIEELHEKVNQVQASIDLETGPLMKLALFHLDDGDRLLIVIHHLVIDGISWRILFEDIETLYGQYDRGEKLVLPPKTDSYKRWAEQLTQYANSKNFLKEKSYWQKIASGEVPSIPGDFPIAENLNKDFTGTSFTLNEKETERLLTKANEAFGTEIIDLLLTAFGMAMKKTFDRDRIAITLEGHGREQILADIDISRTVGWFTAEYPVLFDISYPGEPGRQVKEIKETLRRIPNKGTGFGILKYLTAEANKNEIEFKVNPQIIFNYLGQFDADINQKSFFEIAKESPGNSQGPNGKREYILDVSGMTANKCLVMSISYNKTHFNRETMIELIGKFESELIHLIAFCCAKENRELTPSDFTYKELPVETVDSLVNVYTGIDDIYTLTPMQQGILFHSLVDKSSFSYFEQVSYRLHGNLDISITEKSLNDLFKRHDILRTAFVSNDIERPVQIVLRDRTVDFYYEDMSHLEKIEEKEILISEFKYKDKIRSFDLSKNVLMRVAILRIADFVYEFTWSFHHILMDGWCIGILNNEFFEIYRSYIENRTNRLPGVKPYRTYIQWLERQDNEGAARYWENYLDSFAEQTGVPAFRATRSKDGNTYRNETVSVVLDMDKTAALKKLAAGNQVTLNTLTQTMWGIL
ncbi:MAG TPA: condensation domain-containing protein, partial [Candidatus Kapabacteria bacterium]|nr:condensation domain-containing protein [Candidatus Kapabacteria bacterium]